MAKACAPDIGESLDESDRLFEFLLNALRLKDGFDPNVFKERTGIDWPFHSQEVQGAIADGLLDASPTRICTTELGWRFLDELLQRFLKT